MELSLPPLIRALLNPSRYPGSVHRVELLQTMSAWVLLAGDSAYKIKKPVKFSFMDFSTLPLRHAACQAELRVNGRFAGIGATQQIYLDVLPIVGSPESPRWGAPLEDAQHAIEFAVHMRRFDEAARLDHLCVRGALQPEHIRQLALRMAEFQRQAAQAPQASSWGEADAVHAFVSDNAASLGESLSSLAHRAVLDELQQWTERAWPAVAQQLRQRRAQGRVREGHGDLHLANLVLIQDVVVPFDAIEFNESLRWIDTASDMAFVWMDLQRLGQPGLAHFLLSEWVDACGDVTAPQVVPFFGVYRALVRAKVAAIRADQVNPGAHGRSEQADIQRYLDLARQLAQPQPPRLIITHGLSGSGKSFVASQWLLQCAGSRALRLRSDVERKRLHGLAALHRSDDQERVTLYSAQANAATYASLLARARDLLGAGWTVVVDAAFLRRHERDAFAGLAKDMACPFSILAPQAPLAVLRERILQREAQRQDPSEATQAVLDLQRQWIEPLAVDEPREFFQP